MLEKVKKFLWRIHTDSLLTSANLYHQKVTGNELCPICNQEAETVQHLVWNCGVTNDIWASTSIPTHKWLSLMNNFDQLWEKLVTTLERPDLEIVAIILRFI